MEEGRAVKTEMRGMAIQYRCMRRREKFGCIYFVLFREECQGQVREDYSNDEAPMVVADNADLHATNWVKEEKPKKAKTRLAETQR